MTHYKSLEDLAAEFDRRAEKADARADEARIPKSAVTNSHNIEAETWRTAAILLRTATLNDLGHPPVFRVERDADGHGLQPIRYRANGLRAVAGYLHDLKFMAEEEAEQQIEPSRHWQALGQADGLAKAREIVSLVEIEPNLGK
jgi:hypothetical protein